MTIARETKFLKVFFITLLLLGVTSQSMAAETIYNFEEIKEIRANELKELPSSKILNNIYPGNSLNFDKLTQETLRRLQNSISAFKATNPGWIVADGLLAKLSNPKEFNRTRYKFIQLLKNIFIKELEYDPKNYVPIYYVMPRIIFDFRELLLKKINPLDAKIKDRVMKRLDRYVFTKEGHKEGYIKQLDRRYQLTFVDAKPGETSILGKRYIPGMTFYAQAYTVLGNFSLFDEPYNINSSVLFQFLAGISLFKEPYGILTRDLKRIFPRSLDDFRIDINNRLMQLQKKLDHDAQNYLVQQFIPSDQLDKFSHLEFFGLGFPIYLDKTNNVDYRPTNQPIYIAEESLLSPTKYRNSFIEKEGNPKQYHLHKDLPKRETLRAPIFPIRVDFTQAQFPAYEFYKFPGTREKEYQFELEQIVNDVIQKLTNAKFQDEKDQTDIEREVIPDKTINKEKLTAEIKSSNPSAQIITGDQSVHSGGINKTTAENQSVKSGGAPDVDKEGNIGKEVSSVVQDLAKQLFKAK